MDGKPEQRNVEGIKERMFDYGRSGQGGLVKGARIEGGL